MRTSSSSLLLVNNDELQSNNSPKRSYADEKNLFQSFEKEVKRNRLVDKNIIEPYSTQQPVVPGIASSSQPFSRYVQKDPSRLSFSPCHLTMLIALYGVDRFQLSDEKDETKVDYAYESPVEYNIWENIKSFLHNQSLLITSEQKALRMRGIHDEANTMLCDSSSSPNKIESEMIKSTHENKAHLSFTTQASRLSTIKYSNMFSMKTKSKDVHNSNFRISHHHLRKKEIIPVKPINAMHLVFKMLGKRKHIADRKVTEITEPYFPLLKNVSNRIIELDIAYTNQLNIVEKKKKASGDDYFFNDESSRFIEIQSKVQLWKMLRISLQHFCSELK